MISNISLVRINSVGIYYISKLSHSFTYIDSIIIDTPICIKEYHLKINNSKFIDERLQRVILFMTYLEKIWINWSENDKSYIDFYLLKSNINEEINKINKIISRKKI